MPKLFCVVVGEGSLFSVEIAADETVDDLKKLIKGEKLDIITFDADKLELYLALKDGAWLSDEDPDLEGLSQTAEGNAVLPLYIIDERKMKATWGIDDYFGANPPTKRQIHVLVVVKSIELELPEPTLKRWVELNEVLDTHKKRKLVDGVSSTAYSVLSWPVILPIFRKFTVQSIFPRREIKSEDMNALYACIMLFTKALGGTIESNESKDLLFIAPILIHVSSLVENVQILVEEKVVGKRVDANVRFEFVLRCGAKKICIVVAKKDNMEQGMAENLVGCEALAEVEQLDTVYGIVTNYKEWIFFKHEKDQILRDHSTIRLLHTELPTLESLQDIAETIYAMLLT